MRLLSFLPLNLIVGALAAMLPSSLGAATFEVSDAGDSGPGTLRQAILDANATVGADSITFHLAGSPPFLIQPLSALPHLTEQVTIDGSTQPGFTGVPIVVLEGSTAGPETNGLSAFGQLFVTVKSLVISRWSGHGIFFQGHLKAFSAGHVVTGCYIGTDPTGTLAWPNGGDGIRADGSETMRIGGSATGEGNLISGNQGAGLRIDGTLDGSFSHIVHGNLIGVDVTGTQALGNGDSNLILERTDDSFIGGTGPGERNILSGAASGYGLVLSRGIANQVVGNYIGTDITGTASVPNASGGVSCFQDCSGVSSNLISGNSLPNSAGAVFAGGGGNCPWTGNLIGTDASGDIALPNTVGLQFLVGGGASIGHFSDPDAVNIISGNLGSGVVIEGDATTSPSFRSCRIGLNLSGQLLGNGGSGISIVGGRAREIENCVIAGNDGHGIEIQGPTANGTVIYESFVGTDELGTAGLGNRLSGIIINDGVNTEIGLPGQGNVIAGNGTSGSGDGVRIEGSDAASNLLQGNLIGLLPGGEPLPNQGHGVHIATNASGNQIGGTAEGEANTIAFHTESGIFVESGSSNFLTGNSMFENSGLGIDLAPPGINPNDAGDGDRGANQGQNFPLLAAVTADPGITVVEGSLQGTPSTDYLLEVFVGSSCDSLGHGEGEEYLGSLAITTDSSGEGVFEQLLPVTTPGLWATSTATDAEGNTSEHSPCREVLPGVCSFCVFLDGFESGDTSAWSATFEI